MIRDKVSKLLQEYPAFQRIKKLWHRWRSSPTAINIFKVYAGDIVSKSLAALTALILIRGLDKSDYALYVPFASIATLSASLIGNGINNALVRFSADHLSRTKEKPYTLYLLSIFVELAIFLILLICVYFFSAQIATLLLGNLKFENILMTSSLFGLGNLVFLIGQSILQAEERFTIYIKTLWLKQGFTFLLVGILWLYQAMVFRHVAWGLTILQLLIGFGTVAYSIIGIEKVNWNIRFSHEKYLLQQFLSASGWLIAYYAILAAFSMMDVIMLSRYASEEALADYGVAFKYYSLALLLLGSINAVLRPKFSHIEMQDKNRQRRFLVEWLRHSAWLGVPIILFIFFGKAPFVFINGIQYERSFPILIVFSIGVWLSLMLSPLTNILLSRKMFRFLFLLGLCAFIVNLIVSYIGVQLWDGIGAALAVVLAHNVVLQVPVLWKALE
jgi:O-antigen/teichoic acid export membrane protein